MAHNKQLMILKFHDRKIVHLITTTEKNTFVATGKNDPRTQEPIKKPAVVIKYDKNMAGVDHCDQMVSYATFSSRTLKWWKRVIFHFISLATLNAYLLYKERVGEGHAMLPRQFRKKLVKEILLSVDPEQMPAWAGRKGPGHPFTRTDNNTAFRLHGRHFPGT